MKVRDVIKNQKPSFTEEERLHKIDTATVIMEQYFDILFPGWENDPNMSDTPRRVTKAYVNDICKSLYSGMPNITAFDNIEKYDGIVLQSNIPVKSLCSHHLQNIFGIAHVAYLPDPNGKIIGLSKLNRIVEYYSRCPQVQENLTSEIHKAVSEMCEGNRGVAVIIKAKHMCVGHRGIGQDSDMSTCVLSDAFKDDPKVREELYNLINYSSK